MKPNIPFETLLQLTKAGPASDELSERESIVETATKERRKKLVQELCDAVSKTFESIIRECPEFLDFIQDFCEKYYGTSVNENNIAVFRIFTKKGELGYRVLLTVTPSRPGGNENWNTRVHFSSMNAHNFSLDVEGLGKDPEDFSLKEPIEDLDPETERKLLLWSVSLEHFILDIVRELRLLISSS